MKQVHRTLDVRINRSVNSINSIRGLQGRLGCICIFAVYLCQNVVCTGKLFCIWFDCRFGVLCILQVFLGLLLCMIIEKI